MVIYVYAKHLLDQALIPQDILLSDLVSVDISSFNCWNEGSYKERTYLISVVNVIEIWDKVSGHSSSCSWICSRKIERCHYYWRKLFPWKSVPGFQWWRVSRYRTKLLKHEWAFCHKTLRNPSYYFYLLVFHLSCHPPYSGESETQN